jgi:hypothetical protein
MNIKADSVQTGVLSYHVAKSGLCSHNLFFVRFLNIAEGDNCAVMLFF